MTKGNSRVSYKRVYAVQKERWCGVPCTLLIPAWSLFLLLLITSSISHNERQSQGILAERSRRALLWPHQTSRQILLGPEGDNLHGSQHCFINGFMDCRNGVNMKRENADDGIFPRFAASIVFAQVSDDDTQSREVGATNNCPLPLVAADREKEDSPGVREVGGSILPYVRDGHQGLEASQALGQNVDALQYAEYGAVLLRKIGPEAANSKICLVEDSSGTHFEMNSRIGQFLGRRCKRSSGLLPGQEKSCQDGQEQCYDAQLYGRDIVAELEPRRAYLVCQSDLQSGVVPCDVACSSQSACFLSKVDFNLCHDSGLVGDYLPHACESYQFEQLGGSSGVDLENSSDEPGIAVAEVQSASNKLGTSHDEFLIPSLTGEFVDLPGLRLEDVVSEENSLNFVVVDLVVPGVDVHDLNVQASQGQLPGTEDLLTPDIEAMDDDSELLLSPSQTGSATTGTEEVTGELSSAPVVESDIHGSPKSLSRIRSVASLEEYKRSILQQQKRGTQIDLSTVETRKTRHSDQIYNYAASSHGAKVLAFNKEARGPGHILTSDKDKYLRNPCGAEDKHVVAELSEETFVDTLVISNFEFHSSNLKDLELLGSPVHPTKEWISLGKFQAENVRHRQTFSIANPILVRYVMLKMLSHWGTEFYCTLSSMEVFGVDVIKNLLESDDQTPELEVEASVADLTATTNGNGGGSPTKGSDVLRGDEDLKPGATGDQANEMFYSAGGKAAGDSVLKILLQRVKALEINQTLFDSYLGDVNQKYKVMLNALDKDLALVTDRLRNETILTASLALRLADRELRRKEEQQQMEFRFAQIASNFTDNLDFMRWQIQSMERREISAILLVFLCMILSALLHLLASCLSRRNPSQDVTSVITKMETLSLSSVCRSSSTCVLYLASGLTILILSV